MPNHVSTRLTLVGSEENVQRVVDFVMGDESRFDFNKIIPMPETFVKYDTTNHPDGKQLKVGEHLDWDDRSPIVTEEMIEEFKRATREQREKYGVVGWYDWRRKNWGTKWNCYDVEYYGNGEFYFETAWNAPLPVLKRLSELFPDVEIQFVYADEDAGYNTGSGSINGGNVQANYPEGGSDDAMALFFETHAWAEDEYHKDENGNWVCNDF